MDKPFHFFIFIEEVGGRTEKPPTFPSIFSFRFYRRKIIKGGGESQHLNRLAHLTIATGFVLIVVFLALLLLLYLQLNFFVV